MKLLDAHRIINAPPDPARPTRRYELICGFTPLSLEVYFQAHVRERSPSANVCVETGRFGDIAGNLERARLRAPDGAAVIIEWADVDARLSIRGHGAVAAAGAAADLLASASASLQRLSDRIAALAADTRVSVCLPTLPLPPYFADPPFVAGTTRLRLDALIANFAADLATVEHVRIVDRARLAESSPVDERWDAAGELTTGFPYTREHSDATGFALANALLPPAPKKGLITDLDDTLWRGILGEVGTGGVTWALESGSHVHSLYQQCLANLAEAGVLIAVASKNDAAIVADALRREDFVFPTSRFFPIQATWSPKSAAVTAILNTWNVGPDSVVFVDDSPMELAEVQHVHPDVECLRFDPKSPAAVVALLQRLGDLFGRDRIRAEDRLRIESLRNASEYHETVKLAADPDAFLASVMPVVEVAVEGAATDERALELVNKTNQFNLNGRRFGTSDWNAALADPEAFLVVFSYRDKFGPLGRIGVVLGTRRNGEASVRSWVLSCRAFARRVEHVMLETLFEKLETDVVTLDVARTGRNGPLLEFLAPYGELPATSGTLRITRADFARTRPVLAHSIVMKDHSGNGRD